MLFLSKSDDPISIKISMRNYLFPFYSKMQIFQSIVILIGIIIIWSFTLRLFEYRNLYKFYNFSLYDIMFFSKISIYAVAAGSLIGIYISAFYASKIICKMSHSSFKSNNIISSVNKFGYIYIFKYDICTNIFFRSNNRFSFFYILKNYEHNNIQIKNSEDISNCITITCPYFIMLKLVKKIDINTTKKINKYNKIILFIIALIFQAINLIVVFVLIKP